MRKTYREKYYNCGDYKEVYIYPCYAATPKPGSTRKPKAKPTKEAQKKLNHRESENKLIRLLNANFTAKDLSFDLTYSKENHPADDKQALRDAQNFLRRLKRHRRAANLPPLKYILTTAKGDKKGRYHHHLVINGGVSIQELAVIWGLGYTSAQPLQFNETGLIGKGKYLMQQKAVGFRAFTYSRNLEQPQAHKRDGRLSQRRVEELAKLGEDRREYARLYEGYSLAEVSSFYNENDDGYYLCVRLYKQNATFNGTLKRRRHL